MIVRTIRLRRLASFAYTIGAVIFLLSASLQARPLDDVVASKVLRVVAYEDNKPFSWTVDGKPRGIDVEIGRALAHELGVEIEIILRMQGEEVDDDLRANVWRGPLTGGGVGDIMLHVPTDRELAMRNKEAVIGNPYFLETIAVAVDPKKVPKDSDFTLFKREKIGVKLGTVSDYFLMTFEDGALINTISHYTKPSVGIKEFLDGEVVAIMGVRSEIEGLLKERNLVSEFIVPEMPGIFRTSWVVGIAVDEKSRDLGYAIGGVLTKLRANGKLDKIFSDFGVTYIPPPSSQ